MGQWLTKEWKISNGEDSGSTAHYENADLDISSSVTPKITPVPKSLQHDRLLVLKEDPRSPSGSITRTPIEVVATPDSRRPSATDMEYSPAPSPANGDSPGVGLLKKSGSGGDFQRRIFQRNAPPKFRAFENDATEEMVDK